MILQQTEEMLSIGGMTGDMLSEESILIKLTYILLR